MWYSGNMLRRNSEEAQTDTSPPARQQRSIPEFKPPNAARFRESAVVNSASRGTTSNRHTLRQREEVISASHHNTAIGSRAMRGAAGGERRKLSQSPSPRQQRRRARASSYRHSRGVSVLLLVASGWSLLGFISSSQTSSSTFHVLGASVSVGFGGGCPNACSGHGYCTEPSTETCACQQGWTGGDCSIRE